MKVYIAAPWTHKDLAQQFAATCQNHGHTITREWWKYEAGNEESDVLRGQAIADLDAVAEAEAVVVLQLEKSEGKAAETGYAIALNVPVIALIFDKPGNIFHWHPGVRMVFTQPDVLNALNDIQQAA